MTETRKLPKWAQGEIEGLKRQVRALEERVAELTGDMSALIPDPAGTVRLQGFDSVELPLGKYFKLNVQGIEIGLHQGWLVARSTKSGQSPAANPIVSNIMRITAVDLL